jgi:hypothetical protein
MIDSLIAPPITTVTRVEQHRRRADRRWFAAAAVLTLAFAALAVSYALLVPPLQNADEVYHLHYAQLIANHAQLPGAGMTEKQQPPLYYLLGAAVLKMGGPLTALRLISVVLGALTLVLVMLAARELVPGRPAVALAAGALFAALPVSVNVSSSFSDDSVAWAAGAALVLCIARLLRRDTVSLRLAIGCGIAAGVGLIAKETDWVLVAALALAAALRLRADHASRRLAAIALPACAIAGWWFVRNLVTFHGLVPPVQPLTSTHPYLRGLNELSLFASGAVRSLFGPARPDGGPVPRALAIQALIGALFAVMAVLLAAAAWQAMRHRRSFDAPTRLLSAVLTAACGAAFLIWVLNSVLFDLQPQVRYLFPAAAAPLTGMAWAGAAGLERIHRSARVLLGGGVLAALLWIGVDSLQVAVVR